MTNLSELSPLLFSLIPNIVTSPVTEVIIQLSYQSQNGLFPPSHHILQLFTVYPEFFTFNNIIQQQIFFFMSSKTSCSPAVHMQLLFTETFHFKRFALLPDGTFHLQFDSRTAPGQSQVPLQLQRQDRRQQLRWKKNVEYGSIPIPVIG